VGGRTNVKVRVLEKLGGRHPKSKGFKWSRGGGEQKKNKPKPGKTRDDERFAGGGKKKVVGGWGKIKVFAKGEKDILGAGGGGRGQKGGGVFFANSNFTLHLGGGKGLPPCPQEKVLKKKGRVSGTIGEKEKPEMRGGASVKGHRPRRGGKNQNIGVLEKRKKPPQIGQSHSGMAKRRGMKKTGFSGSATNKEQPKKKTRKKETE